MPYQREDSLQQQLAYYLKYEHPGVIFRSDFAAGIKMTMGQAAKHKRMQAGRAYPDLFVAKPMAMCDGSARLYHGLFLELKQANASHLPYLKNGLLSRDKHIQEQAAVLSMLAAERYYARFAVGFEQAIAILDWYLSAGLKGSEPPHDNDDRVKYKVAKIRSGGEDVTAF